MLIVNRSFKKTVCLYKSVCVCVAPDKLEACYIDLEFL